MTTATKPRGAIRPWPALWSLCFGFFMILVDSTIVTVATPAIMTAFDADINAAVWVTSAYLLAYAVPLLITGRLGDRFGQRKLYLSGLIVFTAASAWCGFASDIDALVLARVFQGLGASMMTPQTMSVITRVFPPSKRGVAMGMWGAVAGVATLVGPVAGGLLVDSLGWEWIFFVNIPVGVLAFYLAWRYVPVLPTHSHRFDILGVILSAIGMFCLVFGIQEGQSHDWGTIVGPITVWSMIGAGILFLAIFVFWQRVTRGEALLPLRLFRDVNFSLANVAIVTVGFTVVGVALPLMIYAQIVLELSPTSSALLLVPMAVFSGGLAPFVGRLADRINPKYIAMFGLALYAVALAWLGGIMTPDVAIWLLEIPLALTGISNACIWSPLSVTATRNLSQALAGAGSGVYNTTRQVGAVLGSAAVGVLMQVRILAELGPQAAASGVGQGGDTGALPDAFKAGFGAAMGQSLLLPAAVLVIGFIAVVFFAKPVEKITDDSYEI